MVRHNARTISHFDVMYMYIKSFASHAGARKFRATSQTHLVQIASKPAGLDTRNKLEEQVLDRDATVDLVHQGSISRRPGAHRHQLIWIFLGCFTSSQCSGTRHATRSCTASERGDRSFAWPLAVARQRLTNRRPSWRAFLSTRVAALGCVPAPSRIVSSL